MINDLALATDRNRKPWNITVNETAYTVLARALKDTRGDW